MFFLPNFTNTTDYILVEYFLEFEARSDIKDCTGTAREFRNINLINTRQFEHRLMQALRHQHLGTIMI
jgi:hypothetical protein